MYYSTANPGQQQERALSCWSRRRRRTFRKQLTLSVRQSFEVMEYINTRRRRRKGGKKVI